MAEIRPIEIPVMLKPVEIPAVKPTAIPTAIPTYAAAPSTSAVALAFFLGLIAGAAIMYLLFKKGYIS
ncbi:MAG: hypothetical protein QXH03_02805 [Candidatus Bathyarchaeia archaeon]